MDDTEFRRAILADPDEQSEQIKEAIEQDPQKKLFVEEIKDLDRLIKDSINIPVPTDSDHKLISMQFDDDVIPESLTKSDAANDKNFWQIAMAASFAFIIGLSINLNSFWSNSTMGAGEYALKNTYQSAQTINNISDQMPLDQVNAQLASYSLQMQEDIGNVQYAKSFYCNINNAEVLHLVVQGDSGNINLYVLPKNNVLNEWNEFGDERFNVKATRYSKADMLIVGDKNEPLDAFQSRLENSMKWSI